VDYWDRRHILKPSVQEAAGYGSVRLYSLLDVMQLKVAKVMKDLGIGLPQIRKSLNYLRKELPKVKQAITKYEFVTDGSTTFFLANGHRPLADTLGNREVVLTISLGKAHAEVEAELKKLANKRRYTVVVNGKKYNVMVEPDLEDGGFVVECPALPGCVSQGDTIEETLAMIEDAIRGWTATAEELRSTKGSASK
jgi:predicted RNase H-like HicB family nuclease